MSIKSVSSPCLASVRLVEFEAETRLERARDALRGLRDLCMECRGDITKITEIACIMDLISRELDTVQIKAEVESVP